jgi:hypothetical protein
MNIFGLTEKEKKIVGNYSNDGVLYTEKQWTYAEGLVKGFLVGKRYSVNKIHTSRWIATGAIAVFGLDDYNQEHRFQYYMRDLVRDVIRDDRTSFEEYQEAVKQAGLLEK